MSDYPERPSYFAMHYTRWLSDSGVAHEIGVNGFAVLVAVVAMEDELRYSRPPNFYNEQLARRCGIASEHALIRARKRCEAKGLLVYEKGAKRNPGVYYVSGFAAPSAGKTHLDDLDSLRLAQGNRSHSAAKAAPSIPNPNPKPKKESKLRFDKSDLEFAKLMLAKIRVVAPKTKEPNLDKWANTIRMMRETDNLTLDEIREVFTWANEDDFWCANILSPDKLRTQFVKLDAQRRRLSRDGAAQYEPLTPPQPIKRRRPPQ